MCSGCGFTKPVSEFHRNKSAKDGLQGWCKECCRAHRKGEKNHFLHNPDCRCQGCAGRINSVAGQKYCRDCDTIKPISEFTYRATYCRQCCVVRQRQADASLTPEEREARNISKRLRKYQLTDQDLAEMLAARGYRCVCGESIDASSAYVDHDHKCCLNGGSCGECIRGLLCRNCNCALGFLKDNPNTALALAAYLMRFENVLQAPFPAEIFAVGQSY